MDQIGVEDPLIQKKIIYGGSKFVPLVNGTKVHESLNLSSHLPFIPSEKKKAKNQRNKF